MEHVVGASLGYGRFLVNDSYSFGCEYAPKPKDRVRPPVQV